MTTRHNEEDHPPRRWQLDRTIPLALVMVLVGQTLASIWWMSTFSERTTGKLENLEKRQLVLDSMPERMAKQEAQLEAVLGAMKGIRDDVRELAGRGARK